MNRREQRKQRTASPFSLFALSPGRTVFFIFFPHFSALFRTFPHEVTIREIWGSAFWQNLTILAGAPAPGPASLERLSLRIVSHTYAGVWHNWGREGKYSIGCIGCIGVPLHAFLGEKHLDNQGGSRRAYQDNRGS
jgi:hypothetical protein